MSDKANASFEDDELTEFGLDHADDGDDPDPSIPSQSQRSRGRPRIQEKWTRVVNVNETDANSVRTYSVANDLLLAAGLPDEPERNPQQ